MTVRMKAGNRLRFAEGMEYVRARAARGEGSDGPA